MKFPVNFNRTLSVLSLCVIFSCFNLICCEKVRYQQCESSKNCDVVSVSLNPCPEARDNESCLVYRGTNVTWSFDYIPKFSGSNLTLQAYGHMVLVDIPYPDQDRDGCKFTKCPVVSGEMRHLEYISSVLHSYAAAPYVVKWKLWNESNDECCITTDIVIT